MTDFEQVEPQATVPVIESNPVSTPIEPIQSNNLDERYEEKTAGFWMRFWAFTVDSLLVAAIVGILATPIFKLMDWNLDSFTWYTPLSIISAVIYFAYFIVMTYYFKQTVGKMIFGLRVVSLKDDKISFTDILFRELIGRLICDIVKPLYLLVIILDKNQGLHDYFADTTVIQDNVFVKAKEKAPVKIEQTIIEDQTVQSAY